MWYVANGKEEVSGTYGKSKKESQMRFIEKMQRVSGENKPWNFWKNKGFRVRRKR